MDEPIKGIVLEKVLMIYSGRYIDHDCHAYLVSKASYIISSKSPLDLWFVTEGDSSSILNSILRGLSANYSSVY